MKHMEWMGEGEYWNENCCTIRGRKEKMSNIGYKSISSVTCWLT